jgi:restriction system protein
MSVPDYQALMLPLLEAMADGRDWSVRDIRDTLAAALSLSEEDVRETISSGQRRFDNRLGWARTYLSQAGLLTSPARGHWRITSLGEVALKEHPERIDASYLRRFPAFVEFLRRRADEGGTGPGGVQVLREGEKTPEEVLDETYHALRQSLADELLERIEKCSPSFFESVVIDLLLAMGYGGSRTDAARAVGRTGDGGVDGIISEDRLGLELLYVQAKRWEGTVGRPVVQAFAGSLEGLRARKGILITTSQFSKEAHDYVRMIEKRIILIDGRRLAQLMIDAGVGVSVMSTYSICRVDMDYFENTAAL